MAIVKASQVSKLPQKFNTRLGAIKLKSRHVDVINEYADFFACPCAEKSFPFLDKLALDCHLDLFSFGLS